MTHSEYERVPITVIWILWQERTAFEKDPKNSIKGAWGGFLTTSKYGWSTLKMQMGRRRSFHFEQDKTKFTTFPSSSKEQMNKICLYSPSVVNRERWGETAGREMQFKIYLIRRLHSSVVPEFLKTYSPLVHFIPIRPNESAVYLREISKRPV